MFDPSEPEVPEVPKRLTDPHEALARRDAHAYSAIEQMAKDAGMTMVAWGKAHPTLTDEEAAIYDRCIARFEAWARRDYYPFAP